MSERERLIEALTYCTIPRTEAKLPCCKCSYADCSDCVLTCRALLQDVLKYLSTLED